MKRNKHPKLDQPVQPQATPKLIERPPLLPTDWWDRSAEDLELNAAGKMRLDHAITTDGRNFVVALNIVVGPQRLIALHGQAATQRKATRIVEDWAVLLGFARRS